MHMSSTGSCPHTLPANGIRPGVGWNMLAMNMIEKPSKAMAIEPIAKERCILRERGGGRRGRGGGEVREREGGGEEGGRGVEDNRMVPKV